MIRPLLLLLLVFSILACKAQTGTNDTLLKMLTYGLPDMNGSKIVRVISPKYGFIEHRVAGCSVTEELKDSVEKENKRVSKILEQRLGNDWEKRYFNEVRTISDFESRAEALVKKQPYVARKIKKLHFKEDGLYFDTDLTNNPNVFVVRAHGWGKQNGKDELIINYKVTVDLSTNTVTNNSDTGKLGQTGKGDTTLKMLIYGFPDMVAYRVEVRAAKKFGFTYLAVIGYGTELKDSIKQENSRVSKILTERFGSEWEMTFNKEVNASLDSQARVKALVIKQPFITRKMKMLFDKENGLYFRIDPAGRPNIFDVSVFGFGLQRLKYELVINYLLTVDLGKNKVTLKRDRLKLTGSD